ncbi:MAG: hypothetical protein WAM14_14485 [Candidatus Nitrosopolaris sp.]
MTSTVFSYVAGFVPAITYREPKKYGERRMGLCRCCREINNADTVSSARQINKKYYLKCCAESFEPAIKAFYRLAALINYVNVNL